MEFIGIILLILLFILPPLFELNNKLKEIETDLSLQICEKYFKLQNEINVLRKEKNKC